MPGPTPCNVDAKYWNFILYFSHYLVEMTQSKNGTLDGQ